MSRADYQVFLDQQLLVLPDFLFGRHSNHVRLSYSQLPADDTLLKQRLQAVMAQLIDWRLGFLNQLVYDERV